MARRSAAERARLYSQAAAWARTQIVDAHRIEYHQLLHAHLAELEGRR